MQIGNSDDKLPQSLWSEFVYEVDRIMGGFAVRNRLHFSGFSRPDARWQNACWVAEVHEGDQMDRLRRVLGQLARDFQQGSIALTVGSTEFVAPREEVQG